MKTLTPAAPARAAVPHRKLFYRIQEVSKLTGLKPYVLRYWESEFKELAPGKDASDQRRYRQADIEVILAIRKLLYEDRFTIEGARKRLKDELRRVRGEAHDAPRAASAPAGEPIQLEDFIPAAVREATERAHKEAARDAAKPRATVLRDVQPASLELFAQDASTTENTHSAAIISIAPEALSQPEAAAAAAVAVGEALAELDAVRLDCAVQRLRDEVNELLEILR